MKIAVIGGAGVRTPLLASGLAASGLPIEEIALFDVDRDRLALIAQVAAGVAPAVRTYDTAARCVADASFVVLSIRAGGIARRAKDEAAAVAHGVVGQETVGPAGFAMAMRNIPPAIAYARLISEMAPRAWIINFTNPVGIVTQAISPAAKGRAIGICDTPTELFEAVAAALGLDSAQCRFDYFGLNHLGWLREVYADGDPQLARVWDDPALLDRIYGTPLFDTASLQELRLLPTEYLFYYYRPDVALANTRRAGATRGQAIALLNEMLFRDLAMAGGSGQHVYEQYLADRGAGYMEIEAGAARPAESTPWSAVTGYDKIAVHVIRAMHLHVNTILPVNVPNRGALAGLNEDDIVEVPCVINGNGAHPLAVGDIPAPAHDLIQRVKDYERSALAAMSARSMDDAVRALARNPLVSGEPLAQQLIEALQPLW